MKRFALLLLCLLLVLGLCACKKDVTDTPGDSSDVSDIPSGNETGNESTTVTTGAMVVTNTQGSAETDANGTYITTIVTALPTTVRPVTDATGTVTKEDGTHETEIVVPPYITVATDTQGGLTTSYVPEQTITTAATTTITTGAIVVTNTQGSAETDTNGTYITTIVTTLPTSVRPVTDATGTVTKEDGTTETEIVVPPYITVATDTQGSLTTSYVPEQTVTTLSTTSVTATTATTSAATEQTTATEQQTASTSATTAEQTASTSATTRQSTTDSVSTTTTTKPVQQEPVGEVVLPAVGYTPDNRIKIGAISLIGDTVTIEIKNISAVWQPEEGKSFFEYTCFDKNNGKLHVGKIEFGFIEAKSSKVCTFTIPEGTTKVELTDFQAEYWSIIV